MITAIQPIPRIVAAGLCLSLLAILFGFLLGGIFGAWEDSIKQHLNDAGTEVLQSVYHGDVARKDAVAKKSWSYLKRAHMHGGAIGATAIGSILALILLCPLDRIARLSSPAFGAGALIYAFFWLFAGLTAPGLGSTNAAKEALSFVAIPGAALCILGLAGTIYCIARVSFCSSKGDD